MKSNGNLLFWSNFQKLFLSIVWHVVHFKRRCVIFTVYYSLHAHPHLTVYCVRVVWCTSFKNKLLTSLALLFLEANDTVVTTDVVCESIWILIFIILMNIFSCHNFVFVLLTSVFENVSTDSRHVWVCVCIFSVIKCVMEGGVIGCLFTLLPPKMKRRCVHHFYTTQPEHLNVCMHVRSRFYLFIS